MSLFTCGVVSSNSLIDFVMRNRRQSVLNFKKLSSFIGKSGEAIKRINLKDPFEYLFIDDFKFLIPQSSLYPIATLLSEKN